MQRQHETSRIPVVLNVAYECSELGGYHFAITLVPKVPSSRLPVWRFFSAPKMTFILPMTKPLRLIDMIDNEQHMLLQQLYDDNQILPDPSVLAGPEDGNYNHTIDYNQ